MDIDQLISAAAGPTVLQTSSRSQFLERQYNKRFHTVLEGRVREEAAVLANFERQLYERRVRRRRCTVTGSSSVTL